MGNTSDIGFSVWSLIHSLSVYEKATIVRLLSKTSDGKKLQFLYNFLNKMTGYDRQVINDAFSKQTKYSNIAKSLAMLKEYIYRNLPGIYQESGGELSRLIQQTQIAIDKNDLDHALHFLQLATQLGWQQERFGHLEIVLKREEYVLQRDDKLENHAARTEQNEKEWIRLGEQHQNYKEYGLLEKQYYHKYAVMLRETGDMEKKQIAKLIDHPLLQSEKDALSVRAKLKFCKLAEMGSWAAGDMKRARGYSVKSLRLFESHTWLIGEYPGDYRNGLRRYILLEFEMSHFDHGWAQLPRFEAIQTNIESERVKIMGNMLIVKFSYCLHGNDVKVLAEAKQELNSNLEDILHFFESDLCHTLLFQAIVMAWRVKDFDSGYKWIEGILRLEKTGVQKTKQVIARIYHLIFLFEEKGYKSISATALRHIRYLRKIGWPHKFEIVLFKFFKSINQFTKQEEINSKLEGLKMNMKEQVLPEELLRYKNHLGLLQWYKSIGIC